jgi:aspartyl protease family protein
MNGPLKLLVVAVFIGLAASYIVSDVIEPARKRAVAQSQSTQQKSPPQSASARNGAASKATGVYKVELSADSSGQYHTKVEIEGRTLNMLVDTGATFVSLTHEDAASLGLRPAPSDYSVPLLTANGELRAARATLRHVRIDTISATNVAAIVLPKGASSVSLLGMSFLKTIKGIEVAGGTLTMRP